MRQNCVLRQYKVDFRWPCASEQVQNQCKVLCASGKSTIGCILLRNIQLKRVIYDLQIIKLKYDGQIIKCSTKTRVNPYPPWYFNTKTHQKQANSGSLRSHSTKTSKNYKEQLRINNKIKENAKIVQKYPEKSWKSAPKRYSKRTPFAQLWK